MDASVIIPTHNRKPWVLRAAAALLNQSCPPDQYEIIVSCDRCADGTAEALRSAHGDRVRVVDAEAPGQCGAMNTALKYARGEVAILLDDEMEAAPEFVAAHLSAHESCAGAKVVVTGYSAVLVGEQAEPYERLVARRYEDYFARLARQGRTVSPNDLCGSNFSAPLSAFRESGGFNESYFFQRNDFELAVRLMRLGYDIVFCPAACCTQRLAISADTIIGRTPARAQADCRLAREYPWCVPHLPFFRVLSNSPVRRRWRVLWETAAPAAALFRGARKLFPDNLRLVDMEYAARYCMGLRKETGSWQAFCRLAGTS